MAYLFTLADVPLPVTPEKVEIKYGGNNKTVSLINGGEINIPKDGKLAAISFDCLLPQLSKYPFAYYENGEFKEAVFFMQHFMDLKLAKKPFSFKILRDKPGGRKETYDNDPYARHIYQSDAFVKPWIMHNDAFSVTLEDFTVKESAAYGLDVVVSIELKEYRPYGTLRLVPAASNTANDGDNMARSIATEIPREDPKDPEKTYTVQTGDTLYNIAKKELGDGGKTSRLYALNKDVIEAAAKQHGRLSSSSGNWIYPGCEIKLQ